METAPKSLRLHLALFGRTNVGKSSFLNLVTNQDVSIISSQPGTTTDVVEKQMELLPLGPVLWLDTAGLDDTSSLAGKRIAKTNRVFKRTDILLLLTEPNRWGEYEDTVVKEAKKRNIPFIIVINKTDRQEPTAEFMNRINSITGHNFLCSSTDLKQRDLYVSHLKQHLIELCPDDFITPPPLISDLLEKDGLAVLIVPIDLEAPKGRLILPQMQTIRDTLDRGASSLVTKESEYSAVLNRLAENPDIVVCDSQVVDKMVAETPADVPCTTFSILFARNKGDLNALVEGAAQIENLNPGDRVLIAEACTHHPVEDDIGREKIPRWLEDYCGCSLDFEVYGGKDFPDNLEEYELIIHCGGCMLNRRHVLSRLQQAREQGVAITNYGICISHVHGVLKRVLTPFPETMGSYEKIKNSF
ncbi:MAG: [FeFe] hydrogenase H-cluster maturation GTPase HydF [bacterium]